MGKKTVGDARNKTVFRIFLVQTVILPVAPQGFEP